MINTILTTTDGSTHAGKALTLAADLANKYNAMLIVMHVIGEGRVPDELAHMAEVEHITEPERVNEPAPRAPIPRVGLHSDANEKIHAFIGDRLVDDAADTAKTRGVKQVKTIVEDGDPASRILQAAKKHGVDMIVMGSRGLGNLKGLLLGSVSQKVNHLCSCTCICVK